MRFIILLLLFFSFTFCKQNSNHEVSSGKNLFSLLPSSETNISFSNDLTYTEEFNPYTYRNFYNGGGVGLGDINNDGLLDIFFCGNQVDSRLYLNKGDFKFEDITDRAGVACHGVWASGVAFVDIDGDGWQDIYVCKSGKPGGTNRHNELFINQHDLSFREASHEYGLDNTGLSSHSAFFDFDRDGDLDCYLLNNSIRTVGAYDLRKDQRSIPDTLGGNKFFRNDNGHFVDISKQAGIYTSAIGFGLGVSVGDLNGDSWPDLYISNDFFERDYLYLNQQNGTFREVLTTSMPEISLNSMGADMADINNDARPEVFVTDMLPESDARYKTKTSFENWEKYTRNVDNGYHHQFIRNVLQLNNGEMNFSEISRYAGVYATDWSWGALIVDLDMDGFKDIFVANGIYKDLTDQDYLNLYNDPQTILGLMKKEKEVIKKLIDAIPSEKLANYAYKNRGDLSFHNVAGDWGLAQPSFSHGSAYGDLDNDGDPDLVVNNTSMPCFIYKNNTNSKANYLRFELIGSGKNSKAIGSQITVFANNQKYFQEIHPMRGFESCVDPRPLFGLGNLVEVDSIKIVWPDGKVQKLSKTTANKTIKLNQPLEGVPFVQDFTAKPLLTEQKIPGLEFVHNENTFNDFERDRLLFNMISKEGPAMAVADINGDHLEDVFIGNAMNSASAFFVQIPGGRFIRKKNVDFISDKGSEDTDASFFDADGDGDQDLYVCSGGNEVPTGSSLLADRLYFNDGKGNFTKSSQILPTFQFESTSCVRPNDIDGDGDLDLFVGVRLVPFNYGVPCNGYILQNDGKGNFKNLDIPVLKKIGMITDARWADIDNDKKDELIVCGEWMPLMIFKNENGVWKNIAHQWGVDSCNGLWQCIQISDIDNDGDIDLIGGNWGLNSRIRPSPLKPTKMYINDFDQNGSAEQILTTYNGDRSYPLTLRQDLVTQLPYLKKKYLEFKNYKNQTINEIFTPDQVNSSIVLTCNTNAHEIFINKNGKFELLTLPKEAQLSPVFSIIIKDINLDGRKDILLGGGFSAVKPELGSYMAKPISLLIQDTEGKFHDSPLNEIFTEVRQFSTIVVNKSGYILSANNNDSLRIWR